MKAYLFAGFFALFLSACTIVKNSDVTTCTKHNCKVRKGFAKNHYGRVCVGNDGSLLKVGMCGGCIVPGNPFKRYSYIKYCQRCQKEWELKHSSKNKE
jgi:hypothetical protein